jgi:DNA-binding response OmpR family regulator
MPKQILIVDDDALLRRSLAYNLERAGYKVFSAGSAEDALGQVIRISPDLVLLDINLPGMDGLEALNALRQTITAPIIFLTARRRELDEVLGLELGADDYITKPFDLDILLARIKVVLRRQNRGTTTEPQTEIHAGDLRLDPTTHIAELKGRLLDLSPREFDLLHTLALQAGKVIPAADLLNQVWGAEFEGQPQVLYVHIRWLREKIEADPEQPVRLITIRGVGYKFLPQED